MSSFMANLFASSQAAKLDGVLPVPPPPLHTRTSQLEAYNDRPCTPIRNSFITPTQTPQGSPSKNRNPPGAIDLPAAFQNVMKLNPTNVESSTRLGRQQGAPSSLSPTKGNTLGVVDDSYFGADLSTTDDAIPHKSAVGAGSPLRRQGKENTLPSVRSGIDLAAVSQNPAALSRQEVYQMRDQPTPTIRRYNTQRGLTAEELEILQKPNVKRLANVTQLCKFPRVIANLTLLMPYRFPRLLL